MTCKMRFDRETSSLSTTKKKALPGHRLVPTFFHCHIDSTASVYQEVSSCSSGRESERGRLFHSTESKVIKIHVIYKNMTG